MPLHLWPLCRLIYCSSALAGQSDDRHAKDKVEGRSTCIFCRFWILGRFCRCLFAVVCCLQYYLCLLICLETFVCFKWCWAHVSNDAEHVCFKWCWAHPELFSIACSQQVEYSCTSFLKTSWICRKWRWGAWWLCTLVYGSSTLTGQF